MLYVTLKNGVKMPQLGYGVYQVTPEECERRVLDALSTGYRSLDTAQAYFNEEQVGSGIKNSGIKRQEIFLTTKVWITNYGEQKAYLSVMESMKKLKTDYLDLVLLHQPFGDVYGAWRALEKLYKEGIVKAIGISNFYPDRMVDLVKNSAIAPMINQIEIHPYFQQTQAISWMGKYNVQPQAWAPFAEGRSGMFDDPVLRSIGANHGKTSAQAILRWHIQRGVVVIPKTVRKSRMEENLDVFDFELNAHEMEQIAELEKGKSAFFSHQDPAIVEWFMER